MQFRGKGDREREEGEGEGGGERGTSNATEGAVFECS